MMTIIDACQTAFNPRMKIIRRKLPLVHLAFKKLGPTQAFLQKKVDKLGLPVPTTTTFLYTVYVFEEQMHQLRLTSIKLNPRLINSRLNRDKID